MVIGQVFSMRTMREYLVNLIIHGHWTGVFNAWISFNFYFKKEICSGRKVAGRKIEEESYSGEK